MKIFAILAFGLTSLWLKWYFSCLFGEPNDHFLLMLHEAANFFQSCRMSLNLAFQNL